MSNIVIAIPTYKRPKMLSELIISIAESEFDRVLIDDVRIIVLDNDIDKSAQEIINKFIFEYQEKFKIHYYNYPIKGLVNVRNELLKKSLDLHPDFIVFIDDDEFVSKEWLNELVKSIVINEVDAARGPVIAKLPHNNFKAGTLKLFERETHKESIPLQNWTTGNLILRRTSLEKYNVWFDIRFNSVGSEDTYFGTLMTKKGAKIIWSSKAIVYETIPETRTKIKWFINRRFRGASMFTYILKLERSNLKIIKKMAISFAYIIYGIITLAFILTPFKIKYLGLLKITEGIGGVAGLFNIQYKEYK